MKSRFFVSTRTLAILQVGFLSIAWTLVGCGGGAAVPDDSGALPDRGTDTKDAGTLQVGDAAPPRGCSDGIVDVDEECDDDNKDNDDGCSRECEIEDHFDCKGEPSVCTPLCDYEPMVFGRGTTDIEVPAPCTRVVIDAWGGGGGGAGSSTAIAQPGGAGGGGAYVQVSLDIVAALPVRVGVGGGGKTGAQATHCPGAGGGGGAAIVDISGALVVVAAGGGGGGSATVASNQSNSWPGNAGGAATNLGTGTPTSGSNGTSSSTNCQQGAPGAGGFGGLASGGAGGCATGGGGGGGGAPGGAPQQTGSCHLWPGRGGVGGTSFADPASNFEGGSASLQGNVAASEGAGKGAASNEDGADGRVVLTFSD